MKLVRTYYDAESNVDINWFIYPHGFALYVHRQGVQIYANPDLNDQWYIRDYCITPIVHSVD